MKEVTKGVLLGVAGYCIVMVVIISVIVLAIAGKWA